MAIAQLVPTIIGILLILTAVGLFIVEAHTPGFGLWFTAGMVSLIVGLILIFNGIIIAPANPWLLVIVIILVIAVFYFVIRAVVRAHKQQPDAGSEEMKNKNAIVRTTLDPEGTVFLEGELWDAVSTEGKIEAGEKVVITKVEGLKLTVKKK